MVNTLLEYVWIDGKNNVRSKTRVMRGRITNIEEAPNWNYDGSSTYQASGRESEIILKPCRIFDYDFS
jgi:glutamine synthetase